MNITRKKAVLLSVIALLVIASIILAVVLLVYKKPQKGIEKKDTCILKSCLDTSGHKRRTHSHSESFCIGKSCISSDESPESNRICVLKNCVSEVERENTTGTVCVEKKSCLIAQPMTAKLQNKEVCLTKSCVFTAYSILQLLHQSINPCDDFYEFSCGGQDFTSSEGLSNYSSSKASDDKISQRIKDILDYPPDAEDSDALAKAKTVYSKCINSSESEDKSIEKLKTLMSSKRFGSWPALDVNWTDCNLDLERQMGMLNAYGVDSFFKLIPEFKGRNNTLYGNIYFSSPLIEKICDDYFESADGSLTPFAVKITQRYRDLMNNVYDLLDTTGNKTESDIDEVLRFDAKFCNATKITRENPPSYRGFKTSLQDLIFIAPQINWSRWHYIIFNEMGLSHRLDKSPIFVHNVHRSIQPLIELIEETPPRTLANYLSWKFVFHYMGFLKPAFRQLIFENRPLFRRKLDFFMDIEQWSPRWKQCVKYVQKLMTISIVPLYAWEIKDFEMQREMDSIIIEVKKSFNETFTKTKRLSSDEKSKIRKKIMDLKFRLFYPDKDHKYFNDYYAEVRVTGATFLESGMRLRKFHLKKLFEGILRSKTITDIEYAVLIYNPFDTSAWSDFRGKSILMSFSTLESTGVDLHQPKYLNFGSFGSMIGQLMGQGFVVANVYPPFNWTTWPKSAERELGERTRCFTYQFLENNTFYHQHNLDIPMIVESAIADNLGVQEVFKAYKTFVGTHGKEKQSPGLDYTAEQLFFIKYAQTWCKMGPSDHGNYKSTKLRVNGALRNAIQFSDTFHCAKGTPMNPVSKCKPLWP